VELFRRSSEVAELVGGHSHCRKREGGKRRSEQGVQILDCADADGDVWAVMLSRVSGKIPTAPCRYLIRSRLFEERYSGLTERDCFNIVRSYCSWRKCGPIGKEEIVLRDDRQEEHLFLFEAFHNGHELASTNLPTVARKAKPTLPALGKRSF
jgi:hypothetical protein